MTAVTIRLRRHNTGTPWGFRLNGGVDLNQPLYIQRITPNGLAHRAGLQPGDGIGQIGTLPAAGMTHEEAKMAIIRAGNDLDFVVQRNVVCVSPSDMSMSSPSPLASSPLGLSPDKEPWKSPLTNLQDPNLQSRSFKLLQQSLSMKQ